MNVALGQIVYSKAGRDTGKSFIVVGIEDENYVLISDGDLRRIDKPKRKKIKHLEISQDVNDVLSEKLNNGLRVTNAEIRKALDMLKDNEKGAGEDICVSSE